MMPFGTFSGRTAYKGTAVPFIVTNQTLPLASVETCPFWSWVRPRSLHRALEMSARMIFEDGAPSPTMSLFSLNGHVFDLSIIVV